MTVRETRPRRFVAIGVGIAVLALSVVTAGVASAGEKRGDSRQPGRPATGASPATTPAADPAASPAVGGPFKKDFVDIRAVRPNVSKPRPGRGASTGTFQSRCGNNENGHSNPDNVIVAPGVSNGAQHTHDYVGNLDTSGFSTDESLARAGTTCQQQGDKSTYYWPVLRIRTGADAPDVDQPGGGKDGNIGQVLQPTNTRIEFRGSPQGKVRAMPRFLRVLTGDAKAARNGGANAKVQFSCSGFTNRVTTKYPLCPAGSEVLRISDFPSCWDGTNTDSANHRTHIVFANQQGACPAGTKTVPQLRITTAYDVPRNTVFAVDGFPDQLHDPITDHNDFINVMSDQLMSQVVGCINGGRRCQ